MSRKVVVWVKLMGSGSNCKTWQVAGAPGIVATVLFVMPAADVTAVIPNSTCRLHIKNTV